MGRSFGTPKQYYRFDNNTVYLSILACKFYWSFEKMVPIATFDGNVVMIDRGETLSEHYKQMFREMIIRNFGIKELNKLEIL